MTERDSSRDRPGDQMVQLTVAEAARVLGITEAGVRKRVQRAQIPHERTDDGRLLVWISPGEARQATARDESDRSRDRDKPSRDQQLEDLRDQVRYLRAQLDRADERDRENRRIIAALTSRIPELPTPEPRVQAQEEEPTANTPPEERLYAVTPTPQPGRVEPQPQGEGDQESSEAQVSATEMPMGPTPSEAREAAQEPSERVSWWRRMFGG